MKKWLRALVPYVTSAVVHAVALGGLAAGTLFVARKIMAPPPLDVELIVQPKVVEPDPEPDPKERKNAVKPPPDAKPPPPRPRARKPRPQKILVEQEAPDRATPTRLTMAAPQPEPPAPTRGDEPVREGPPAPTVFGLDMDSADQGGTFEVAQGNTVATSPSNTGPVLGNRGRSGGGGLLAPPPAPPIPPPEDDTKITSWPARLDDLVFKYPEEARRSGTEGSVKLRLSLDAEGRVAHAELLQPADPLLDAAALEGVKKLRFSPALAGKKPVPCEIPYTFTFVLD